MKRTIIVCVLAAALAACGQNAQAPGEVEAPNYDSSIGPQGAAGIASTLTMDVNVVREAAPAYIVNAVPDEIEGDRFTAITLSAGDEEVFRIYPAADRTHIHSIVTRSSQARGPLEEIVGVALFASAPPEEVSFCRSEMVGGGAGFACSTGEDGQFWRVYSLPEVYDGPSDPFDAIDPDVLHDATLAEMRWVAPPPAASLPTAVTP